MLVLVLMSWSCNVPQEKPTKVVNNEKVGEYIIQTIKAEVVNPKGDTLTITIDTMIDETLILNELVDMSDSALAAATHQTAFIVIVDTGKNYKSLHEKMFQVSRTFNIDIDTMDRGYNVTERRLTLAADHPDEIYAGSYFPRRYDSDHLSIEHLTYYTKGHSPTADETMALVACITDSLSVAKGLETILKPTHPNAFIVSAELYLGCMH